MDDNSNTDEPISNRRSKRSCRSSIVQSKPNIEVKEVEVPVEEKDEVEEEDPPEVYQPGDIFWVRIPGNPWWPALLYGSYYENYIHTKVSNPPRRPKKRLYFFYFFGPAFEYAWSGANAMIPYLGLDDFIQQAQASVQKATKKHEQEILASRYELKVAANKRSQWDKAIQEADEALKLTREQRIENFAELLKTILENAKKNKTNNRRNSSMANQSSKKSLTPPTDNSTNRSSIKRQKTKSTTSSKSIELLRVGLPELTSSEETCILNNLLDHSKQDQLTLQEALSFTCKSIIEIVKENSHYDMTCVQIEWFYDFLLKYPEIVSKYSHWFNEDTKSVTDDPIYLKQCQLKVVIQNQ